MNPSIIAPNTSRFPGPATRAMNISCERRMRLLYDTNVVFDVIERRAPHYSASLQMLKLAQRGTVEAAWASHTLANIFYKYQKTVIPDLKSRFLNDFEIVCGNANLVRASLDWDFPILEDALQVAARWRGRPHSSSPATNAISDARRFRRFHRRVI